MNKTPPRVGRNETLIRLVAMRKEIENLITQLSGDKERQFLKNIEAGQSHSIRTPRPGENLLTSEEIEDRWGVVEDHSGEIPESFLKKYGHHVPDTLRDCGVAPATQPSTAAPARRGGGLMGADD